MFKVNDRVIYPGHGVAVIEEVVEKVVAGSTVRFFKLSFPFKSMTVLIPQQRLENSGVRGLSNEKQIDAALRELRAAPLPAIRSELAPSGWSRRHREYQLRIQGGLLVDIAAIYRDLVHTAQRKELSFGEKTMMHLVEDLFVQEVMAAHSCDRDAVVEKIRTPFKGMRQPFTTMADLAEVQAQP